MLSPKQSKRYISGFEIQEKKSQNNNGIMKNSLRQAVYRYIHESETGNKTHASSPQGSDPKN